MNSKSTLAAAIAAALIAGSLVTLFAVQSASGLTAATAADVRVPALDSASAAAAPGGYLAYSEKSLADADGRVFLFFHASWCPSCVQLKKRIAHDGVPDGVTILEVDFDTSQDLRERYGVTYQTTFVEIDSAGDELQQFLAYNTPGYDSVIALL